MFPWNFFPNNENIKKMGNQFKPIELDQYIQELMGKMIPQHMEGMMKSQDMPAGMFSVTSNPSSLPYTIFDTHEYVYVRIKIKDEEWLKKMKLFYTSNLMIIEHIPNYEDKHTITLPALVKKKGAASNYKEGSLEIKIPKNIDMQFCEIDVSEIT